MKLRAPRMAWITLLAGIGTLPVFARQDAPERSPAAAARETGVSSGQAPAQPSTFQDGGEKKNGANTDLDAPPARAPLSSDESWASLEIAPPEAIRPTESKVVKRSAGPSKNGETKTAAVTSNGWLRTLGSLAAVVGAIVLLAWGYRSVAQGRWSLAARGRQPGLIEILSRTALSPRQSLCLVRVGPRLVLVGVSPDGLQSLDVIADADLAARLSGQAAQQRPNSRAAEFCRTLERETRPYEENRQETPPAAAVNADTDADTDAVAHALRIIDLKKKLSGTMQRLQTAGGRSVRVQS